MRQPVPGPYDPQEMRSFLETFLYQPEGFLIDEVLRLDQDALTIEALMDTTRALPIASLQRASPRHPAHVTGAEMIVLTANLGGMHAWFFHGCRWDAGWSGFGTRIHRAEFKRLATLGPPLRLQSRETRTRLGAKRIVLRLEFRFWQEERLVYRGDQSAVFLKDQPI